MDEEPWFVEAKETGRDPFFVELDYWKREAEQFRRLLESKQEELARVQRALDIERIQWRESLREKDEETQRWRRKYEAKEWG